MGMGLVRGLAQGRMIDEALSAQATTFSARTSRLSKELTRVSEDVSERLDVLTAAFVACIQLNGVRGELAGFAEHARARREVRRAIEMMMGGGEPADVGDVPGYWPVPVVNALRPDGSAEATQLAAALERDEEPARLLEWVGDHLMDTAEPVDASVDIDQWQGSSTAPPAVVDAGRQVEETGPGSARATEAGQEGEATWRQPPVDSALRPALLTAEESTRAMPLPVLDRLVSRGVQREHELLRRVEQLRDAVIEPLGLGGKVSLVDERPTAPIAPNWLSRRA